MIKYEKKSFIKFYFLNFEAARLYYKIFGFFITDTQKRKNTLKLSSSTHEKYEYGHLGRWHIKLTLFKEVLKLEQIFQKNKVVNGKTPLFVINPFCSRHSICLNGF